MMWPLTLVALDIIVETAMGQESNIQTDRENEYAKAIFSQFSNISDRQKNVQLWPEFLWNLSSHGRQEKKNLKILQDFTKDVINTRLNRFKELKEKYGEDFNDIVYGHKNVRRNRIAFLGNFCLTFSK